MYYTLHYIPNKIENGIDIYTIMYFDPQSNQKEMGTFGQNVISKDMV